MELMVKYVLTLQPKKDIVYKWNWIEKRKKGRITM